MVTEESDELTQWEALVHYHLKVDPDTMDDNTFFKNIGRLRYALISTGQWKD